MEKNYSVSKQGEIYDKTGYRTASTVEHVAKHFGVSTRRIRYLLEQGRLAGHKEGRTWHVSYPISIRLGKRGPQTLLRKSQRPAPLTSGLYLVRATALEKARS